MSYWRVISVLATLGVCGYTCKTYNEINPSPQQCKNCNLLLQTKNPNSELHKINHQYMPDKRNEINEYPSTSKLVNWWNNFFKVNADEFFNVEYFENENGTDQVSFTIAPLEYLQRLWKNNTLNQDLRPIVAQAVIVFNKYQSLQTEMKDVKHRLLDVAQYNTRGTVDAAISQASIVSEQIQKLLLHMVSLVNNIHFSQIYGIGLATIRHDLMILDQNIEDITMAGNVMYDLIDKLKEENVYDSSLIEERANGGRKAQTDAGVKSAGEDINTPLKRKSGPKFSTLKYKNFTISYATATKLPVFYEEVVTKENVRCLEHRHWEKIKIWTIVPPDHKCTISLEKARKMNKYDVVRVGDWELYSDPADADQSGHCVYCNQSNFWPFFYRYLVDLTGFCTEVRVWSAVLYKPIQDGADSNRQLYESRYRRSVPVYFLKAILYRDANGCYKLECFKVKNEPLSSNIDNLTSFHTTREQLEKETGLEIFRGKDFESKVISSKPHHFFERVKIKQRTDKPSSKILNL